MVREDLRNIAIIAHVDHGKTTLVDEMLKQGGVFRDGQVVADRVMDSGDLERERGITILSKNTSVHYNGTKINIIDTPGHADFGGEVERVLKMVDGVLLLVDAYEGPMPQTRFVLEHALALGLRVIIVVNKIDRPDARTKEIEDEVLELFLDLDASEEQLESTFVYCSARQGTATLDLDQPGTDLRPLFETILKDIPAPEGDENGPLQLLVSSIDYNEYVGRIGIGRIERGVCNQGQDVVICDYHGDRENRRGKLVNLYQIEGLNRSAATQAKMGDIVCFSGIEEITIGETVCQPDTPEPLPFVKISEPTVEMTFAVNDSPFAGKEGKYVTSRQLRERLYRELLKDVSLRVTDTDTTEAFNVAGRGEMHLSILIETLRREGYGLLGFCNRWGGLYPHLKHHRHTGGNAPQHPAAVVGGGNYPAIFYGKGVVVLAAGKVCAGKSAAKLYALNGGYAKHGIGQHALHCFKHGLSQPSGQAVYGTLYAAPY